MTVRSNNPSLWVWTVRPWAAVVPGSSPHTRAGNASFDVPEVTESVTKLRVKVGFFERLHGIGMPGTEDDEKLKGGAELEVDLGIVRLVDNGFEEACDGIE